MTLSQHGCTDAPCDCFLTNSARDCTASLPHCRMSHMSAQHKRSWCCNKDIQLITCNLHGAPREVVLHNAGNLKTRTKRAQHDARVARWRGCDTGQASCCRNSTLSLSVWIGEQVPNRDCNCSTPSALSRERASEPSVESEHVCRTC